MTPPLFGISHNVDLQGAATSRDNSSTIVKLDCWRVGLLAIARCGTHWQVESKSENDAPYLTAAAIQS